MNTSRIKSRLYHGAIASLFLLMSVPAHASGHSLSFAGGLFNYSSGTFSSTGSTIVLSSDGSLVSTGSPYTLDFSGTLTGGGNTNGSLSNVVFDIKNSVGTTVFAGKDATPAMFVVSGQSAAVLGSFTTTTALSPVAGVTPGGSFAIALSGWTGVTTSGSGSGGTFSTSVPEAGSSAALAFLVLGGTMAGIRRRRR